MYIYLVLPQAKPFQFAIQHLLSVKPSIADII